MTTISIIGSGNMATAIGTRAAKHGHTIEVMSRDTAKAQALGKIGTEPPPARSAQAAGYIYRGRPVHQRGFSGRELRHALAGKVIIDISNTFNADATGLVTPDGISGAQEIAKAAPASAHVVKAFNTVFGHVLAQGRPLDVLIAGDDARAKASVSAFIESLGLRPLDTGDLAMAHWLEGVGPLLMGLARHGAGFNIALGVNVSG